MSEQALTSTEPVLFESGGGLFKGKMRMFPGRFELTATRIVYYKRSLWWQMFGMIGALFAWKNRGKREREIELASVASIARGKYALNKKILDFTFTDGTTLRISVTKFEDFIAQLAVVSGQQVEPLAA
jgi:hypothetical protein